MVMVTKEMGFLGSAAYVHAHKLLAYHQLIYFRMVVVTEQMGFLGSATYRILPRGGRYV